MRHVCPALALLALSLTAAPPAGAASALTQGEGGLPDSEQYILRVEGRLWGPSLASEIQVSGSETGTDIDVPRDLGVGDKGTFEVRAAIQLGLGHKVRLGYTNLDYDGDKHITKDIRFQNTFYPRQTRLVTSLKGAYYAADYEWDVAKGHYGYFGAVFGGKVFDVDALLVAPDRGDRDVETLRVPVPVIGLVGRAYAGRFSVAGELEGFTIGATANFVEVDLLAQFDLSSHIGVDAGYRVFDLHGEHSNDSVKMRLGGLYVGAEINF